MQEKPNDQTSGRDRVGRNAVAVEEPFEAGIIELQLERERARNDENERNRGDGPGWRRDDVADRKHPGSMLI